jgi:hypothetical protein
MVLPPNCLREVWIHAVKKYEEIAPAAEEIGRIMSMAKEAFEEWRKGKGSPAIIADLTVRRVFYAAYYLGVLTGKAVEWDSNEKTTPTPPAAPPGI